MTDQELSKDLALLSQAERIVSMVLGSCALENHIFDAAFRAKLVKVTFEDLRKLICQ